MVHKSGVNGNSGRIGQATRVKASAVQSANPARKRFQPTRQKPSRSARNRPDHAGNSQSVAGQSDEPSCSAQRGGPEYGPVCQNLPQPRPRPDHQREACPCRLQRRAGCSRKTQESTAVPRNTAIRPGNPWSGWNPSNSQSQAKTHNHAETQNAVSNGPCAMKGNP